MKVHVFSYSPRQGTEAAGFGETVPPPVVAERRERLRLLERETADAYLRGLIGRRLDVLVEGEEPGRPGFVRGTACRYAVVAFRGHAPALIRRRVPVRARTLTDGVLWGEPESDEAPAITSYSDVPLRAASGRRSLPLRTERAIIS